MRAIAAARALQSPRYYRRRWAQTHRLRVELARGLQALDGLEVVPGVANFLLVHLAARHPGAHAVVAACRKQGIFLRDAGEMSRLLGDRALRISVRDRAANARALDVLERALSGIASAG